jgi:predicted PurR-regulated permease PerM
MGRQASFWVLVIVAAAVGVLFFRVMQPFLLPLLLACVVAMLVRPYYEWTAERLGKRRNLAAALYTLLFLLVVLLPLTVALFVAGRELLNVGKELAGTDWENHPLLLKLRALLADRVSPEEWNDLKKSSFSSVQSLIGGVYSKTQSLISNVIELVVGLAVTSFGLFYFLTDGPQLAVTLRRLSPLDTADEEVLLEGFEKVCRGVVLATLACALFQAVAAGLGFAILGVHKVWLLSVLTMFTAMIPFIGAASVWGCVAVSLFWTGHWQAGLFLVAYGSLVVSSMDNLLRAYVIHDSAQLHPLVALISVLGAIQVVGLWGILLGPVVASFFYALLKILRDRHWDSAAPPSAAARQPIC